MSRLNQKKINLVITGGCGFIGVNLVRFLLQLPEPPAILVVDNFSVGKPSDLERVTAVERSTRDGLKSWQPEVRLIEGDILDSDLALEICSGADAVVHLAANAAIMPSIEDPQSDCLTNVLGTLNYLEASRLGGVGCFVLASSSAPLGDQEPPISEELVPHPVSPYGASKLSCEAYCSAYHGSFGLKAAALRFSNAYGPYSGRNQGVISRFIRQALAGEDLTIFGDGRQTRDFLYADDVSTAVWACLNAEGIGGDVFHIATKREYSINEVAAAITRAAGPLTGRESTIHHSRAREGEVKRSYSEISKAREALGWQPEWDLKQGLDRVIKWYTNETGPASAASRAEEGTVNANRRA